MLVKAHVLDILNTPVRNLGCAVLLKSMNRIKHVHLTGAE